MVYSRSGNLLAVGVACALAIPATQADIYRWVGEDGGVVYSDSPPKDGQRVSHVIASEPPAPVAPAPPAASAPGPDLQALAGEVEKLRSELAAERRARRAAESMQPPPPAAASLASDPCDPREPRFADCYRAGTAPYFPATVLVTTPSLHRVPRADHRDSPRHFKRDSRPGPDLAEHRRVPPPPLSPAVPSGQRSFRRH